MKVRVGNLWFNSDDVPILIELDEQEQHDIGSIFPRLSVFPESMYFSEKEKQDFIDGGIIRVGDSE